MCKQLRIKPHPARFPKQLPEFFIKFLTEPKDLVIDIFSGSNTTGQAAESLSRNWLSFEINQDYIAASSFRFLDSNVLKQASEIYNQLREQPSGLILPQENLLFDYVN